MTQLTPILELQGVSKSYGAVRASRNVSIALRSGEVRALAGENGAGKSTIVRMLAGVQRPDDGEVLVDGRPAAFSGPADARDAGVAVIYQEPTLFPDLSIAENVMMGRHPLGSMRRIDRKALQRTVGELMDRLGVKLDPEQPVRADRHGGELVALCGGEADLADPADHHEHSSRLANQRREQIADRLTGHSHRLPRATGNHAPRQAAGSMVAPASVTWPASAAGPSWARCGPAVGGEGSPGRFCFPVARNTVGAWKLGRPGPGVRHRRSS